MTTDPVRVLLVDDDEDDYFLTRDLFTDFDHDGFELEWVATYAEALAAMLRGGHDVYLLDYRLGARTGLDLLREAAQRGFRGPVIMLTGQEEREIDVEAMRAGAADYLVKNHLEAALLERSIRYTLEHERHQEALRHSRELLEQRVLERTAELARTNAALQAEIAERKHAEAELTEADRRKDEFLAMLAHELRNPLAPLLNGLEVLRVAKYDPAATEPVRELMERQMRKMVRLVDDLLDVSRITSGKIGLQCETVDVRQAAQLAADSVRQMITSCGQQLSVALPPGPLLVDGDLIRLEQVISNLLSNASKYTEPGGNIKLAVEQSNGEVLVRVSDTGVGIAPDMLPKVFGLFVQVDRSLDRSQGGLGIGLTLVKRLVELHGGRVEAHSAGLGSGSEFLVRLPLLADQSGAGIVPALAKVEPPAGLPGRVLLVDDNADLVRSLALMLQYKGYEVKSASDGPAAIELAQAFEPQAVLLDIGLPGMNGYEVAQQLRQAFPPARLLLVALSGYGRDEDRQQSQAAGFDLHLVKPVGMAELTAALAGLPADRQASSGSARTGVPGTTV
jgi:signal transduction histidine kinase